MNKFFLFCLLLLFSTNLYSERRGRVRREKEKVVKEVKKDPTTAVLLSIIPGGGQYYNGNISKGVLYSGLGVASIFCIFNSITIETKDRDRFNDTSSTIFPGPYKDTTVTYIYKYHPLRSAGIISLLTVIVSGGIDAYFSALKPGEKYGMKIELDNKYGIKLSYNF